MITDAERHRIEQKKARKELEEWIDGELTLYVKDMINDGDYATLRRNLIDIAEAHAKNCKSAAPVSSAPEAPTGWQPMDDERWQSIREALRTKDLSDGAKLHAIAAICNSREPLTERDIQLTRELFPAVPPSPPDTER